MMREARPEIRYQADIIKLVASIKGIYIVSALDILPDDVLVPSQDITSDVFQEPSESGVCFAKWELFQKGLLL